MSEVLNSQLNKLSVKESEIQPQQQQVEEMKSQEQPDQLSATEVKKKKVIKSVRFNLENKRAAIQEKTAKDIQEIMPVGESKGLFPATLPAQQGEQVGDQPTLDQAYTDKEMNEMEQIKKWLFTNLKRDIDNAKAKGANPIELKVRNFILIRKDDTELWNRVEFDTSFDFSVIEQILISPEEAHPTQPTLKYAMIVLFGKNKNIPLVFPYCYQKQNLEDFEQEIEDSKNKKEKKKLKKKLKKKMGNFTPNELDNWILVNSQLKESYHKINEFQDV